MTNHVRTLLLNLSAEAVGTTPGEEYVPRDFRPAALPADLQRASAALFGPGADRAGRNVQLARILSYLHASPLAEYVTAADARLTYRPDTVTGVFDRMGSTVTNVSGSPAVGWSGAPTFPAPGRAYGAWAVTTDGAGDYTVIGAGESLREGAVDPTTAGDAVPLPGSRLSLVVGVGAAGQWRAELLVPPAHNFADAARDGDPGSVFRPARSGAEALWYGTWHDSPSAALRAGAFALALAARTHDVITGTDY